MLTVSRDLPAVIDMVHTRLEAIKPEAYLRMWRHSQLALYKYLLLQPI